MGSEIERIIALFDAMVAEERREGCPVYTMSAWRDVGRKAVRLLRDAADTEIHNYLFDEMVQALTAIKWKSCEKDNMEYAARITAFQLDDIRSVLSRVSALSERHDTGDTK